MTGPALMTAKIMAYDTSYSHSYDMSIFNEYERTYELCNEHTVCMYSGNVIKFNTYNLKEPFIVNNHDIEFHRTLEQMRIENSAVNEQADSDGEDDPYDSGISLSEDEAAAKLLTDTEYTYEEPVNEDSADAGDYDYISDDSEINMGDEY